MSTAGTVRPFPPSYFALVRKFPLAPIQDDDHLAAAQQLIDRLLERNLDPGEEAYLDVLTDLVERYEAVHVPIPDATEADVLRELMRSNGLGQSALAAAVGIAQSTVSAVLAGSRSLTKRQVIDLAAFFHVPPAAFLPDPPAAEPNRPRRPVKPDSSPGAATKSGKTSPRAKAR